MWLISFDLVLQFCYLRLSVVRMVHPVCNDGGLWLMHGSKRHNHCALYSEGELMAVCVSREWSSLWMSGG